MENSTIQTPHGSNGVGSKITHVVILVIIVALAGFVLLRLRKPAVPEKPDDITQEEHESHHTDLPQSR